MLGAGDFFGEQALGTSPSLEVRLTLTATTVLVVPKAADDPGPPDHHAFSDRFIAHMLARNIRIEEDLVDQLFNSSEKRLARALLLLARYGKPDEPSRADRSLSGDPRGNDRNNTFAGKLFHEQVQEAGFHRIQRGP